MPELAPKIWKFYTDQLQQVKTLPRLPEDLDKTVNIKDGTLYIRKRVNKDEI